MGALAHPRGQCRRARAPLIGIPAGQTLPGRHVLVARSVAHLCALLPRASALASAGRRSGRLPRGWCGPVSEAARGSCAWWRSLREAALGPSLSLPRLRNGFSQQPKFCLVSQGASSPIAAIGRHYGYLLSFIKGNKHKHRHARNWSAPAHGCVPGFVAQSPASQSGGFGGCQLLGRECV